MRSAGTIGAAPSPPREGYASGSEHRRRRPVPLPPGGRVTDAGTAWAHGAASPGEVMAWHFSPLQFERPEKGSNDATDRGRTHLGPRRPRADSRAGAGL